MKRRQRRARLTALTREVMRMMKRPMPYAEFRDRYIKSQSLHVTGFSRIVVGGAEWLRIVEILDAMPVAGGRRILIDVNGTHEADIGPLP